MARAMDPKNTSLYRTIVRKLVVNGDGDQYWTQYAYGPYDSKAVNRNYDWDAHRTNPSRQVLKQELKPVFNLTPSKGLVLGLEWVTYEQSGAEVVEIHEH